MQDLPKLGRKVLHKDDLLRELAALRELGQRIVFTNGCFDVLHYGHVYLISRAAEEGDAVIVGLNSDKSVRRLKGELRPINSQDHRAAVMAALEAVSYVTIFEEDTPELLVSELKPDVLVKGGDWKEHQIAGAGTVKAQGGKIVLVPYLEGFSTTEMLGSLK